MRGLSKDTDLSFIQDKQLIQLALGQYEFQLVFEDHVRISIQSIVRLEKRDSYSEINPDNPQETKDLALLLGKRVSSVKIGDDGEITLYFEGECNVTIFDTNANIDSYLIWNESDYIAV